MKEPGSHPRLSMQVTLVSAIHVSTFLSYYFVEELTEVS